MKEEDRERIKVDDFLQEALAIEDMNEELSDVINEESKAWLLVVYFCDRLECWNEHDDFPYTRVKIYEDNDDSDRDICYNAIFKRKSDGKLFRLWSDYEHHADELFEVEMTHKTIEVYE